MYRRFCFTEDDFIKMSWALAMFKHNLKQTNIFIVHLHSQSPSRPNFVSWSVWWTMKRSHFLSITKNWLSSNIISCKQKFSLLICIHKIRKGQIWVLEVYDGWRKDLNSCLFQKVANQSEKAFTALWGLIGNVNPMWTLEKEGELSQNEKSFTKTFSCWATSRWLRHCMIYQWIR